MPRPRSSPGPRGLLTTTQRGYGYKHRRLRQAWAPRVAIGEVACWRCGNPIQPGTPWELGHHDEDRTITMGPEHKRCNRLAAAKRGYAAQQRSYAMRRLLEWGGGEYPKGNAGKSQYEQTELRRCECGNLFYPRSIRHKCCGDCPPVVNTCVVCNTKHTRPKYCSNRCMWIANGVIARNRYRARVGLPVDAEYERVISDK